MRIHKFQSFLNLKESMKYPSMEEVDSASHMDICRWYRFLDSPGMSAIGHTNFDEVIQSESRIMDRISDRLKEFGGFTPDISKSIGWK